MRRAWHSSEWDGLLCGVAALCVLGGIDILLGSEVVITTSFVIAVFAAALIGGVWATVIVGASAVVLAAASGAWNHDFESTEYWVRLGIVLLAAGFAVLAARTRAEARESMHRFQVLDRVASIGEGSVSVEATLERLTDIVVPELADICLIDTIARGEVERVAVRASGPQREEVERILARRTPSVPDQIVEGGVEERPAPEPRFLSHHTDEVLRELANDPEDLEFLRGLGTHSSITVPLAARGRALGALTIITASSGRRYRRSDLNFARVLAGRVALVLDNAGLFSDLLGVERRTETVMAVLDEAVVIHDDSRRFVFANQAAARILGYETPEELIGRPIAEIRERHDLYDEAGKPLAPDDLLPLGSATGGPSKPQILRAISRVGGSEIWLRARSNSAQGPTEGTVWSVAALEDVTEIKEREFEQTMLARTGELLASSIDYREMLQRLAGLAIPQLADWCSVYLPGDGGTIEQVALAHHDEGRVERVRAVTTEYPMSVDDTTGPAEVLRTGEPILLDDISPMVESLARDDEHLRLSRELGMGSAMLLPMRFGGRVIGTLNFVNDVDRRPFDKRDQALAEKIAQRAAVAMENARLATERSEIASTLQRGLLAPPLPDIPGWAVSALFRPAGEENEVGGDFYEVFEHPGGWMLAIGDVTGRGARAAAVTAAARYTLRTAGALTGDPVVALAQLNRALLDQGSLCTVVAISMEREGGELRVAIAGHPPPLLVSGGRVREIGETGPVLGAFEDCEWPIQQVALEVGEHLVVYTDGVTEAAGPQGRFGEQRLHDGIAGTTGPNQAIGTLERLLEEFTEGDLEDDAAVLAIARAPGIAPAGTASTSGPATA